MTETFTIYPGQVRLLWVILPMVLVLLGAGALLGFSISGARLARFEVSPAGLRLRGDMYGRLVPSEALDLNGARVVDLQADRELQPVTRTMGTALPGYRSGWFRLRGGTRALLYVTDPSRVAYVPTHRGYGVMVSVEDPARFIAALRREAGGDRHPGARER